VVISAGDAGQCCRDSKLPRVKEDKTKLCSITYRKKRSCKVDLQKDPRSRLRYCGAVRSMVHNLPDKQHDTEKEWLS